MLPVPTMPMPRGSMRPSLRYAGLRARFDPATSDAVPSAHASRPDRPPALHGPPAARHGPPGNARRRRRGRLSVGRAGGPARHCRPTSSPASSTTPGLSPVASHEGIDRLRVRPARRRRAAAGAGLPPGGRALDAGGGPRVGRVGPSVRRGARAPGRDPRRITASTSAITTTTSSSRRSTARRRSTSCCPSCRPRSRSRSTSTGSRSAAATRSPRSGPRATGCGCCT